MMYYDGEEMLAMRRCTAGSNGRCLSQEAVARLLGMHRNTVYGWETRGGPKWAAFAYESLARKGNTAAEEANVLAVDAKACAANLEMLRKLSKKISRFLDDTDHIVQENPTPVAPTDGENDDE